MNNRVLWYLLGTFIILLLLVPAVSSALPGNGTIRVGPPKSGISADVFLDGSPAGVVPPVLYLAVPAGTHQVLVSAPGADPWSRKVLVRKGQVTVLAPDIRPSSGRLVVETSPPGADVFLDGLRVGLTPMNTTGVSSGSHVVTLRMTGYKDVTRYVLIRPPPDYILSVALTALPVPTPTPTPAPVPTPRGMGSLIIRTPEDGYGINLRSLFYDSSMQILDGRWHYQVGKTPAYWMNAVPQGKYTIQLTNPGNASQIAWCQTVSVFEGKETLIDMSRSLGCPWGIGSCL